MPLTIRFLGQSCFELTTPGSTVLIDPYLTDNPLAAARADEMDPDTILLTHGHFDHLGDTVEIAKRSGAGVVAIKELAEEIAADGVGEVHDPVYGGTVSFDWGTVKLVPAWHSAVTPKGTVHPPAGLVVSIAGSVIYHLGDTALFSDLALPARYGPGVDIAIIPIGGHYTMDRHDAVIASELVGAPTVIPCHYDTFPIIEADVGAFAEAVAFSGTGGGGRPRPWSEPFH